MLCTMYTRTSSTDHPIYIYAMYYVYTHLFDGPSHIYICYVLCIHAPLRRTIPYIYMLCTMYTRTSSTDHPSILARTTPKSREMNVRMSGTRIIAKTSIAT